MNISSHLSVFTFLPNCFCCTLLWFVYLGFSWPWHYHFTLCNRFNTVDFCRHKKLAINLNLARPQMFWNLVLGPSNNLVYISLCWVPPVNWCQKSLWQRGSKRRGEYGCHQRSWLSKLLCQQLKIAFRIWTLYAGKSHFLGLKASRRGTVNTDCHC